MTRVVWTKPAVEHFALIRQPELRKRLYRAIGGLAYFPRRGRKPPEVDRYPDLEIRGDLREIVFPPLARVFYLYDEAADVIRILGMSFRGREITAEWLARLMES